MSPRQREQTIRTNSAWTRSDLYSIEAKADGARTMEMMRGPMMQTLLEDRFKLKIHRETREVPVYALTVDKGGPKLRAAKEGGCLTLKNFFEKGPPPEPEPGQPSASLCDMIRAKDGATKWYSATLASFCRDLSLLLDRDVIDRTNLAGVFDIQMELSPADLSNFPGFIGELPSEPTRATDPFGSSIFTAVTTLGLKLKPAKGPGGFLVIDHVERPSEN